MANCQARPIATPLEKLSARVKISSVVITHLAKDGDEASLAEDLPRADFVFAQAVRDAYPIRFVRTSYLRGPLGGLVTWPNLFSKSQCPDLSYLTFGVANRILGPLGGYQSRPISESWRAGKDIASTKASLLDGEPRAREIPKIARASIAELELREKELDVAISPRVERQRRDRRSFFTFNNPSQSLMSEVSARPLESAEMKSDGRADDLQREPLDQITPALLPVVGQHGDAGEGASRLAFAGVDGTDVAAARYGGAKGDSLR